MYGALEFLNDDDRRGLAAVAEQRGFEAGEVIVREGEERDALFCLRSGSARVERDHMGFAIEIASLGSGELFGEMSLIDGRVASASVVAVEPTRVDVIDRSALEAMFARDPGFYGRFYHSLAKMLSGRLRETTVQSIADYGWGGEVPAETGPVAGDGWSGGNPLRDAGD